MFQVVGILLAAGSSRRFGSNKLLAPLAEGTPVGVAAARSLIGVLPDSIAVVRPADSELAALLRSQGLQIVECAQAEQGMGHTLAAAIGAAARADAWLIALADMPFIQSSTHADLVARLVEGTAIIAPHYQGRRGHPVGFAAEYGAELLALTGESGARDLLSRHASVLTRLEVDDPGILLDIDTPADLRAQKNFCARTITS